MGTVVLLSIGAPRCAASLGGPKLTAPTNKSRPDTKPRYNGIFHIPWIAYLSPELADGLKVTSEILSEHAPDGGLLMSVTTERFDPTNTEHLRCARILAETMIERTGYQPGKPMYA